MGAVRILDTGHGYSLFSYSLLKGIRKGPVWTSLVISDFDLKNLASLQRPLGDLLTLSSLLRFKSASSYFLTVYV